MHFNIKTIIIFLLLFIFTKCNNNQDLIKYKKEIFEWDKNRIERLKSKNGWLNLVGLYWLKEGENSFGSSKNNDIVFPQNTCPDSLGTFILHNKQVYINVKHNNKVLIDSKKINSKDTIELLSDKKKNKSLINYKSLQWYIIERNNKIGVRLRNFKNDNITKLKTINRYPVQLKWKVKAQYIEFKNPETIKVPNVLGEAEMDTVFGKFIFEIDNKHYELTPLEEKDYYFIIFGDLTNGTETYGAGRFLYVPKGKKKDIILDFNKAYNPPCVFTEYATCPIPPKVNKLNVKISAGEKIPKNYIH